MRYCWVSILTADQETYNKEREENYKEVKENEVENWGGEGGINLKETIEGRVLCLKSW